MRREPTYLRYGYKSELLQHNLVGVPGSVDINYMEDHLSPMTAGTFLPLLDLAGRKSKYGEFSSGLFNMETIRFQDEACGNPMATA